MEAQRRARQAPAEEAEPKAEQSPKGKATPLAKPKAKPQPQPQAPHPASPPPPALVARKQGLAAVPAEEDPEVEEARGELKGLLGSLTASKAAKGRAETKVSQWETKLASLREGVDAERIRWGEANLRKAKAKVAAKEEAIEGFDRAVGRSERELAAVVARVKEEEAVEVVELDVEAAQMKEEILEEEEEAKVVVATLAGGAGEPVAQGDDGVEGCGGPPGPAMGPGCPGWPPPPKLGHPPPRRPGESDMDSPVFVGADAPPAVGGGAVGMGGRGGGCPPGQAPAPRDGQRVVAVAK